MISTESIGSRLATVFSLAAKTAIITGAGSGLGRATARLFADVGARVVVADINAEAAQATVSQIKSDGGTASWTLADVSDEEAVKKLFADAHGDYGSIDILVNNAAYRSKAELFDLTADEWNKMHSITSWGTLLCAREAIHYMRKGNNGGSIVNISSMSAAHTNLWGINYHYDAAKSGVDALTRGLAGEFAADNIRVNSVLPGGMKSEGGHTISSSFNIRGPVMGTGRIPLGRMAAPIEVAHAVLFLASPAASYITGQMLAAEGGFLVG